MPSCAVQLGKIAMAPDIGKAGQSKHCGICCRPGRSKIIGMLGKGAVHQLAFSSRTGWPASFQMSTAMPSPGIAARRDTPAAPGCRGKTGDNIGAARNRRQLHIGLDVAVDIIKAFRHQRRAGGKSPAAHKSWLRAAYCPAWRRRRVLAEVPKWVPRSRANQSQQLAILGKRAAVKQQERGFAGQAADQPVPHHPAAGGEVKNRSPGRRSACSRCSFEMLQQRAARAVDNALGLAGGAAGKQDVQRVIERQAGKFNVAAGVWRQPTAQLTTPWPAPPLRLSPV